MERLTVGLFNDSFPPTIDGVANVTLNYAEIINRGLGRAVVATPYYPKVVDDYPFEVIRYPSIYIKNEYGYRTGYPFDVHILSRLEDERIDVIHSHCPCISTVLARTLRAQTRAPIVFTYHTKFDIDINNLTASDMLRRASINALRANIEACDDVWVVSEGAGENLRSLGYEGEYTVMSNGTDYRRGTASESAVRELREKHGIAEGEAVALFVGRMMWYKGIRISLDGLKAAREAGADFRFLLVGDGGECEDIKAYVEKNGMGDFCEFVGAIRDRELLRAYFTLADIFLFPSTFDTNGMVVREAAACSCPSLLIGGSCAAEGIRDGVSGLLIEENALAMRDKLLWVSSHLGELRAIGEEASRSIYLSWDDAVGRAFERYHLVLERGGNRRDEDSALLESINGAYELLLSAFEDSQEHIKELMWSTRDHVEQLRQNLNFATEKAKDSAIEQVEQLKQNISTATEKAKDSAIEQVEQLKQSVNTARDKALETAKELLDFKSGED